MLALPVNFEAALPIIIHWVTAAFLAVSILLCLFLYIRRFRRNYLDRVRARHNHTYDELINRVLSNAGDDEAQNALLRFRGRSTALARSMLNVFRTVRGSRAQYLSELVSGSVLEKRLIKATRKGTRGYRMRALQVLSYLETERSLEVVRRHLQSRNRYERLTAARALTRRKSYKDFASIISSLSAAFPRRTDLLAEVIVNFGPEIQPALEAVFRQSRRTRVRVACLDGLRRLAPANTSLDLSLLMEDPSDAVRDAAISLSAICDDTSQSDLLLKGLADEAIAVKISAAKVASAVSRPDTAPLLYRLSQDPSFWVRYWAVRAMWGLGKTGQQMVASIARSNDDGAAMAANVAREMEAAHA